MKQIMRHNLKRRNRKDRRREKYTIMSKQVETEVAIEEEGENIQKLTARKEQKKVLKTFLQIR